MWIQEFREAHNLKQEELAELAGVSVGLVDLLENMNKAVTHPVLANRIAEICGATAAQRDSIVHRRHRGTWQPSGKKIDLAGRKRANPQPPKPQAEVLDIPHRPAVQYGTNRRAVVVLTREGVELARHESIVAAGQAEKRNLSCVAMRCARKVGSEWKRDDRTYRYADEWDAMNEMQRRADMAGRYSRARK